MNYPASGRWPEPNTLWLSAAFMGDDPLGMETNGVIHMYPEERPSWCTIDKTGCEGSESLTYMGSEHECVVRDDPPSSQQAALLLGGRAGQPTQDPAGVLPVPPAESFRLRGVAPPPEGLPGSAALAQKPPAWAISGGDWQAQVSAKWPLPEGADFRVRSVEIAGLADTVSVFEVADPTEEDGCDIDSPRSALCGGVLWPGARSAAESLVRWLAARPPAEKEEEGVGGAHVVEVGAGTGLVSLVAAKLGVEQTCSVLATDGSTATLELIEAAAAAQDLPLLRTAVLDLLDERCELPERVDVAIAADLLYSEELARGVARTLARMASKGSALIVTDSQWRWRDAFTRELALCLGMPERELGFVDRSLGEVTGWSYADGADATYEVTVGVLEVGADREGWDSE